MVPDALCVQHCGHVCESPGGPGLVAAVQPTCVCRLLAHHSACGVLGTAAGHRASCTVQWSMWLCGLCRCWVHACRAAVEDLLLVAPVRGPHCSRRSCCWPPAPSVCYGAFICGCCAAGRGQAVSSAASCCCCLLLRPGQEHSNMIFGPCAEQRINKLAGPRVDAAQRGMSRLTG